MKKRVVLGAVSITLIICVLSIVITGCDDKEDLKPIDLTLMPGIWEVVVQGEQDVFDRGCLLNLSMSSDISDFSSHGYISTFYLTATGNELHDKVYSWSIRDTNCTQPMLNLVLQDTVESDDLWEGDFYYRIVKLTESHMWWKVNTIGDNSVIKFCRRTDIDLE